jgi:hypothetical protein
MNADLRRGAAGVALIAVGVVAVLAGWLQLRSSNFIAEQIAFATSGGLLGLVLVLLGIGLISSSNSRVQLERLRQVEDVLRKRGGRDA